MGKNKMSENKKIAEAYEFFEGPNCARFGERKPLLKDYYGNGVEMNGFILRHCAEGVEVWKPTDIGKDPQYKGEPLLKIIPFTVATGRVIDILECQRWTYV